VCLLIAQPKITFAHRQNAHRHLTPIRERVPFFDLKRWAKSEGACPVKDKRRPTPKLHSHSCGGDASVSYIITHGWAVLRDHHLTATR
jgi:hypothetical protein